MEQRVSFVKQKWDITYNHATGETAGTFLTALGAGKLMGKRCPECQRVLVPPRTFCDRCYTLTTDWVELEDNGTIDDFTIVYRQFQGLPPPPYAIAHVRPNNADTAILGFVKAVDLSNPDEAVEKLKIGTKVKVIFKDKPEGRVTDFWFELA